VLDVVTRVFAVNVALAALALATVAAPSTAAQLGVLALGVAIVAALLAHLARGKPGRAT
jgi:hypothetical protein